jgi:hypothetical protein
MRKTRVKLSRQNYVESGKADIAYMKNTHDTQYFFFFKKKGWHQLAFALLID